MVFLDFLRLLLTYHMRNEQHHSTVDTYEIKKMIIIKLKRLGFKLKEKTF